jgi:hypothetical protein
MDDPSHHIIARFTDRLARTVLAALGEEHVRSVFVGGSVAGEEASYSVQGDIVEFYSDADLYVVVADDIDLEAARRRAREAAGDIPLETGDYRFFRGPDVGVYSAADLAAQPARPGTVGLDRQHVMLFGDPGVVLRAAGRIGDRIDAREALYLLENRLTELSALQQDRSIDDRHRAFVVCKTGLDVATAALIDAGAYHPRRSERLQRFNGLVKASGAGWTDERVSVVRGCEERLQRMPSPDWADGFDAQETAASVVSLALDEWKRIAAGTMAAESDDWNDLVLRRCRTGEFIRNFRQFRAMNARCGFKRRGALAAGARLSRYSPMDALRLSALMEYSIPRAADRPDIAELIETLGPYLDRLTRECGFSRGSLVERTFAMYSAAC